MKKMLLLVIVSLFFVSSGYAAILASKHDLTATGTGTFQTSETDETCVFCHTPHAANPDAAVSLAPLWNRQTADLRTATLIAHLYGNPSGTMNDVATLAAVNSTDAPLCLSCHDGLISTDLVNEPNTLGADPTFDTQSGPMTPSMVIYNGTTELLSNDHPIGVTMGLTGTTTSAVSDSELKLPTNAQLFNVDTDGDGTADFADGVWCSSCHDAHNNTNSPFLITSNAGSALCTDCHIK